MKHLQTGECERMFIVPLFTTQFYPLWLFLLGLKISVCLTPQVFTRSKKHRQWQSANEVGKTIYNLGDRYEWKAYSDPGKQSVARKINNL